MAVLPASGPEKGEEQQQTVVKIYAAGSYKATAFCESNNKKCTVNHA